MTNGITSTPSLRPDFREALERNLDQALGLRQPDSPLRAQLESLLTAEGHLDLEKLPESAQRELVKLQQASEGFESFLIKDLLAKMRPPSLTGETSAMGNFARDMLDQAISESAAKGKSSIGLAEKIFVTMGESVARQRIAEAIEINKNLEKR